MGWKIRKTLSGSQAQLKALRKQRRSQQQQPVKRRPIKGGNAIVNCDYCGREAKLVHSSIVYGEGADYGMLWYCRPCKAWVGCHKNSKIHTPLGRLANAALRNAKIQVHSVLDPLWDGDNTRFKSRSAAYKWLAKRMHLHASHAHIGMFNIDKCDKAIRACNEELRRLREKDGMED